MASATSKNTRNRRFVLSAHRHFQGARCVDSCTRSRRGPHSPLFVSLLHASFLFDNYAHSSLVPGHSLLTHCPREARKRKDVRTSLSIALDDAHRGSTFHRANNARDFISQEKIQEIYGGRYWLVLGLAARPWKPGRHKEGFCVYYFLQASFGVHIFIAKPLIPNAWPSCERSDLGPNKETEWTYHFISE